MAMPSVSDAKYMLERCAESLERLSDWEKNFVYNVLESVERSNSVTQPQYDKIEQIYQKVP